MSVPTGSITRRKKEISVLVGDLERRFTLSAHSIAQQLEQLERQEAGRSLGIQLAEEAIGTATPLTGGTRAYLASLCPVVVRLLANPADDGGPLTEEEFWLLDTADPERVIGAQEELTNMAACLGNGLGLLGLAGRQILEKLQQDGSKSDAPSPEPG